MRSRWRRRTVTVGILDREVVVQFVNVVPIVRIVDVWIISYAPRIVGMRHKCPANLYDRVRSSRVYKLW